MRRTKGTDARSRAGEFLTKYGRNVYGEHGFVVLGLSLAERLERQTPPDADGLVTRSVTLTYWRATPQHPRSDEFSRYLSWKRQHSRKR